MYLHMYIVSFIRYLRITVLYVQVINKPCARRINYMRLIPWTHHRGSEHLVFVRLQWMSSKRDSSQDSTGLLLHTQQFIYRDCTQCTTVQEYNVLLPCWNWLGTRGVGSLHMALPPSAGLGREVDEVRGRSSQAVSAGAADTAYVEAVQELPARGVQKPSRGVGEKQFQDIFLAAPAAMVKIPAGLKTRRRCGLSGVASAAVHAWSLYL